MSNLKIAASLPKTIKEIQPEYNLGFPLDLQIYLHSKLHFLDTMVEINKKGTISLMTIST
jgi:hypothetical protein